MNKWGYNSCKQEALKYKTRVEFRNNSNNPYKIASKNGWLNDFFGKKSNFTKDECEQIVSQYKSRDDLRKNRKVIYNTILKNKWDKEMFLHMIRPNKIIWTKELCWEKSNNCESKTEFNIKYNSAYKASLHNNWLDEICSHMRIQGNLKKRFIYVYEFSDNHIYVGLTCNIEKRNNNHRTKTNSSVYKHIQKTQLEPILKIITNIPIDVNNAIILEGETVEKYKREGWIILNKIKTGGIGGNKIKWTEQKCLEEALKHKKKSDFGRKSCGAYYAARKLGILEKCFKHMEPIRKRDSKYTYEICKDIASTCKNKRDFSKKNSYAYSISRQNKWIDNFIFIGKNKIS